MKKHGKNGQKNITSKTFQNLPHGWDDHAEHIGTNIRA